MNHPPTGLYSNATSPRSSLTSSTCGPGTPLTNSNDSEIHRRSVARASVFDAYFQLGMFEENSPLASWVFDDRSTTASSSCGDFTTDVEGGSSPASRFREKSGSRFRERLDSDSPVFVLNNWQEDDGVQGGGSSRSPKKSKASGRQQNRSVAGQRPNSIKFATPTTTTTRRQPQGQQPNAARPPFSIFRSRSSRSPSSFDISQEDIPEVPEIPKKGSKRPPLPRSQTHPPIKSQTHSHSDECSLSPLGRPSTASSSEWEKIDPLSTLDFNTLASTENPFLHGPQSPNAKFSPPVSISTSQLQIPFPSAPGQAPSSSSLMQRLSAVVTRPFHHSSSSRGQHSSDPPSSYKRTSKFHSLRRTQSSVATDTVPRPFLLSSPPSSPPDPPTMHRLMPSISHS